MAHNIGDWTTWEGLNEENTFEPEKCWGKGSKPAAASGWAAPSQPNGSRRVPTPGQKKNGFNDASLARGINKKKKAPRGAGLMTFGKTKKEEDEEEAAVADVPAPYIVSTKNAFAVLGDLIEQEETTEVAAAAEAAKAQAMPLESPMVRRTRNAIKAISKTMISVVAAVSPMLERHLSSLSGSTANVTNAETKPTATKPPTKNIAAAPVRRSSRLARAA